MSEQIEAFRFQEHRDFEMCFPKLESGLSGGQNRKEYILSLSMTNPRQAINRLDDDGKSTLDSIEGAPVRRIVSESGLYSLALGSQRPEAKSFK